MNKTPILTGLLWAQTVWAHEGHGLPGASHWHASDLMGFALALAIVIGMIWFNGRDR
jgi:type IV secretory pathway TrbF-like protein